HYEHYLPIPEKEWLLIHRLFFLSVQNKIAGFITADNIHFLGRKRSIANLYNLSLLLGCGRLNHLTPAQIRAAGKSLQDWCTLISISRQPSSTSDNQLVVDITSGSAPHFKKLFTSSANSVSCYLQVDKLIDTLDRLLPDEKSGDSKPAAASFGLEESTLDKNLIVHLRSAWSEYIYREIREETEEPLMVCTGFYNVHYHLCGGKTLKDFIGEKVSLSILYEEDEDIATIEKQRSTDVWSAFTTIPDGDLVFGEIPAEFNFQHFFPFNAEQADNDAFPETRVVMTDRSTKGCCLQWPQNTTDNIEVGELIGLRKDNKHHLQIGEIAWKDLQEDGRFRTGIHILSSKAIPIAVDVPLSAGSNQNFAEAILLPAEEALGTQCTSFLSRPDYYKKGNYLSISQKGIEEKVHLSETVTDNAYFARFDCGFILKKPVIGIDRSTR
ncbi:MAG: hypothetical protein KDI30_04975, partial [Pseudomonadales bacterium]|nr:hypothetical protein [Pseudomonadales bacterium]